MSLIDDFAAYVELPVWFAGGLLGLAILFIVLAISLKLFRAQGLMVTVITLAILMVNITIFAWPFWPAVVVGVTLLWQFGILQRFSIQREVSQ